MQTHVLCKLAGSDLTYSLLSMRREWIEDLELQFPVEVGLSKDHTNGVDRVRYGVGSPSSFFFFLNDPAPPEFSPLPLPDPLPIGAGRARPAADPGDHVARGPLGILEPHLDAIDNARGGETAPATSGAGGAAQAAEGGVPAGRSRAPSARDRRELDRPAEHRGELARDPPVTQTFGPIGGTADHAASVPCLG